MKVSKHRLDIILAKKCMSMSNLKPTVSPQTLKRIGRGEELLPKTVGKIARALGVDVVEIIEEGC